MTLNRPKGIIRCPCSPSGSVSWGARGGVRVCGYERSVWVCGMGFQGGSPRLLSVTSRVEIVKAQDHTRTSRVPGGAEHAGDMAWKLFIWMWSYNSERRSELCKRTGAYSPTGGYSGGEGRVLCGLGWPYADSVACTISLNSLKHTVGKHQPGRETKAQGGHVACPRGQIQTQVCPVTSASW